VQETSASVPAGLPIEFDGPMAIVGGGAVDGAMLTALAERGVALVGADGGGDVIGAAGLVPAAIIGDLDSLADRAGWERRTRVVHVPEQMTTDFEKAVYCTSAPVTIALGMTGKRFDHTMAGLHVIMRYARSRRIILVDEHDIAMGVSGALRFEAEEGERVSLHPLERVRFERSQGLLYPLEGITLEPGVLTGVSNAGLGGPVVVEPALGEDGVWLLILGKERLWDLVEALAGPWG
jgi:thiamine pyrophosphokinase